MSDPMAQSSDQAAANAIAGDPTAEQGWLGTLLTAGWGMWGSPAVAGSQDAQAIGSAAAAIRDRSLQWGIGLGLPQTAGDAIDTGNGAWGLLSGDPGSEGFWSAYDTSFGAETSAVGNVAAGITSKAGDLIGSAAAGVAAGAAKSGLWVVVAIVAAALFAWHFLGDATTKAAAAAASEV